MTAIDLCPICGEEGCEHSDDERNEAARALIEGREPEFHADDPVRIKHRTISAKVKVKHEVADFKELMGTPLGRRFMWRLLERCHVNSLSCNPTAPNALCAFYADGERNIGLLYTVDMLRHCVDAYSLMVKENGGK